MKAQRLHMLRIKLSGKEYKRMKRAAQAIHFEQVNEWAAKVLLEYLEKKEPKPDLEIHPAP